MKSVNRGMLISLVTQDCLSVDVNITDLECLLRSSVFSQCVCLSSGSEE